MPGPLTHTETTVSDLRQGLAPEARALLCCARVELDAGRRAELRALASSGLDYAGLAEEAERHGLTPLLFRHLQAELGERCPPEFDPFAVPTPAEDSQGQLRHSLMRLVAGLAPN